MDPRVSSTLCQSYSKVQCAGKTGFHSGLNGSYQDGRLQYEAGFEIAHLAGQHISNAYSKTHEFFSP